MGSNDNTADALKRTALDLVHDWLVEADKGGPPAPAGPEQAAELPEGGDFDVTDLGDTHNLYEALYRCPRWPYSRSHTPWAVQQLAQARQELADLRRRRGESTHVQMADDSDLEAMLD